jgi:hypothetical protein
VSDWKARVLELVQVAMFLTVGTLLYRWDPHGDGKLLLGAACALASPQLMALLGRLAPAVQQVGPKILLVAMLGTLTILPGCSPAARAAEQRDWQEFKVKLEGVAVKARSFAGSFAACDPNALPDVEETIADFVTGRYVAGAAKVGVLVDCLVQAAGGAS